MKSFLEKWSKNRTCQSSFNSGIAVPYFDEIEGRLPLHPLQTISETIPGIFDSKTLCRIVLKNEQVAAYLWLLEEDQENLYLLFFM